MNLLGLGLVLIIIGFLIVIISLASSGKAEVKYSFFGLIGPIPFGFGNDRKLFVLTMVLAIMLIVFVLFYQKGIFK